MHGAVAESAVPADGTAAAARARRIARQTAAAEAAWRLSDAEWRAASAHARGDAAPRMPLASKGLGEEVPERRGDTVPYAALVEARMAGGADGRCANVEVVAVDAATAVADERAAAVRAAAQRRVAAWREGPDLALLRAEAAVV